MHEEITNDLTNAERETAIHWSADCRDVVEVFTDDPVEYRRLLKKGHTPYWSNGKSAKFRMDARWLTIRTWKEYSAKEIENFKKRAEALP